MRLDPDLLDAVVAAPEADGPRYVLADWLEDRFTAWARLIRRQVAASRAGGDRAGLRLRYEADDWLVAAGARVRATLPRFGGLAWGELQRGFVHVLEVSSLNELLRHADEIARLQPVRAIALTLHRHESGLLVPRTLDWLDEVRILALPADGLDAREWPVLRTLVASAGALVLGPEIDVERVLDGLQATDLTELAIGERALAPGLADQVGSLGGALRSLVWTARDDRPHLPPARRAGVQLLTSSLREVEELDLAFQQLSPEEVAILSAACPALHTVALRGQGLDAMPALAPGRPLLHVELDENELTVGALGFLDDERMVGIRSLSLAANPLTADVLPRIASSRPWRTLRELDLSHTPLAGLAGVLPSVTPPPELHTLRLVRTELRGPDVRALLGQPWVRRLARLDLGQNALHGELPALDELPTEELSLAATGLQPRDLGLLHRALRRCRRLDLSSNPLGIGLAGLLEDAPQLTWLRICSLNDRTMRWTVELGRGAPKLCRLDVSGNPWLGTEGLRALLEGPLGDQLTELDIGGCGLDDAALEVLLGWPGLERVGRLGIGTVDRAFLLELEANLPEEVLTGSYALPWTT